MKLHLILLFILTGGLYCLADATEVSNKKPNVLFISIDDLNDWVGALNGNPQVISPHMDKLFEQGVLFTNAHCSQAVCTASRNSLLSGLHPTTTGWYSSTKTMQQTYDEVMAEHKMLPQYFKDNGYKTLAVGKIFHQGVTDYKERTSDFWDEIAPDYKVPKDLKDRGDGYGGTKFYPFPREHSQIITHYGKDFNSGQSLCYGALEREDMPEGKMFDELISEWAVDKLNEDHEKPFFMAVGFVRPHVPYTAPKAFFDRYDLDTIKIPEFPEDEMTDIPLMGKSIAFGTIKTGDHYAVVNLSDTYWKEMVYGYLACISFVDHELGKVLNALENSKYAENTVVVLWSDHGQHLGEKKHWRKQALWEESTKVPLCFKVPGVKAGKSHSAVSLLDIYPTLLEICNLPKSDKVEGNNLLPLIKNPDMEWDKPVLSSWYYKNHAVRSNHWHYIQYRDGTEELYNHTDDPGEHINLAGNPKYARKIKELQKSIPKHVALTAGQSQWEPDKLDRRIETWLKNDSIPMWLR